MNPAERLHSLLLTTRKTPDERSAAEVLCGILGVKSIEDPLFCRQYWQLFRLVDEVEAQLMTVQGLDQNRFLSWVRPVRTLLSPAHFHRSWKEIKPYASEVVLQALDFAAYELSRVPQLEEVPTDQLQNLQTETEQLIEDLLNADLDQVVKSILIQQADNIRLAILAYRLRGPIALREALEQSIGTSVLNGRILSSHSASGMVERVRRIIRTVVVICQTAAQVKELAGPLWDLLGTSGAIESARKN
jgi:hypothetical protein